MELHNIKGKHQKFKSHDYLIKNQQWNSKSSNNIHQSTPESIKPKNSINNFNKSLIFKKTKNQVYDDNKYLIKDNLQPSEQYKLNLNKIMEDYKYDDELKENELPIDRMDRGKSENRLNIKRSTIIEKEIRKVLQKNNPNKSTIDLSSNTRHHDESIIKVSVQHEEFHNPFQSLEVIDTNKNIFEAILKNYSNRQTGKFEEVMKTIFKEEKYLNQLNSKSHRIKVTNIMPKSMEINPNSTNGIKFDGVMGTQLPQVGLHNLKKDVSKIDLYSSYIYSQKNFPEGREQFSWCMDMNDIILFGGIVTNKNNNVWQLDPVSLEWKKLVSDYAAANPRYGHSGVLYQKKLYVFGGKTKSQNYFYIPDLEIFSIEDRTWSTPSLFTKGTLKLRRNHVAKVVGHHMFVHGGISEEDEYLNDCYLLLLAPSLKWVPLSMASDQDPPTLAWHSACLVLPTDQKNSPKLNIYKLPEQNIGRRMVSRIKEKGIYFFGGKSNEEGALKNDLWVLKIGKKPCEWIKINPNGAPPKPRYAHSMSFYEEGNYLIIHGGRNDFSSDSFALNDTYLLEMSRMDWIKVNLYFNNLKSHVYGRCGHSSIVYTNKLIIFGGMNNQNYIGSSLFVVDLDSHSKPQKTEGGIVDILNIRKSLKLEANKPVVKEEGSQPVKISALKRQISMANYNDLLPAIK